MKFTWCALFVFRTFILMVMLLVLASPAPFSAQAAEKSGWVITDLKPAEPEICLGQTISVYGSYAYKTPPPADYGPLAPLTGPAQPDLAPLKGPEKITAHANQDMGRIIGMPITPGLVKGDFQFEYFAAKDGQDSIAVDIIDNGKTYKGESVDINVTKKCVYSYRLVAHLFHTYSDSDGSLSDESTLKAVGKVGLEPDSMTILSSTGQINWTNDWIDLSWPLCQTTTADMGLARGNLVVSIDLSHEGLIKVTLSKPQSLKFVTAPGLTCNGQPYNYYDINADLLAMFPDDPWIEETFLPEGGTVPVKVFAFDEQCKDNFMAAGHVTCSYEATLTVKREKGE